MNGYEQSCNVSFKLFIVDANFTRRFVAQNDHTLSTFQGNRADEVDIDEGIGDALECRFKIAGERSFEEPLRDLSLTVHRDHLLDGEHGHGRNTEVVRG